jgi:hypothetical protein
MAQLLMDKTASVSPPAAGTVSLYPDTTASAQFLFNEGGTAVALLDSRNTVAQIAAKDFQSSSTTISDASATSKAIKFSSSGATASTVLTISQAQTTSQTLSIPNIAASSIIITDTLAQTISGAKTFSAAPVMTNALPVFTKLANINAAGAGVPCIYASAAVGPVTSTQTNLINYTPPAAAGRYRLSYTIANTAGTNTGSTTATITYKDAAGIAKSYTPPLAQEGSATWLTAATAASKNFHSTVFFGIDNSATAITATFTISGTVATWISATLEQLA